MKIARRLGLSVLAVALVAAPSLGADASQSSGTPYIVGGSVVSPTTKYPFFVSLNNCGASLVRSTWVLTAAHCVDDAQPDQVTARIGVFNLADQSDGETRTLKRIIVHPQWNQPQNNNDVALLELDSASSRPTIELARAGDRASWQAGSQVTVMGHGRTVEGGAASDVLKELTAPVIDDATMATPEFYGTGFIAETMVGAGVVAGGEDSCQGDSGGPLVTTGNPRKQVGVVSFGEGCARPNKPGVYARVGEGPLQAFVDNTLGSPPDNLAPRFAAESSPCGRVLSVPVFGGFTEDVRAYDPEDEDDVDSSVEDVELDFGTLPSYAQATQRDEGDNLAIGTIVFQPTLFDLLIDFFAGPRTVTVGAVDNDGSRSECRFQVRTSLFGGGTGPGGPGPR